jgi:hypothetical protein
MKTILRLASTLLRFPRMHAGVLGAAMTVAVLGLTTAPAHAQTGGRTVTRTYRNENKPTFQNTFHGGDVPQDGDTGGVGGVDPSSPPTGTWTYTGGVMVVDNFWVYTDWNGTHGQVWYINDTGAHWWGTWEKVGTFSPMQLDPDDAERDATASGPGTHTLPARDERRPGAPRMVMLGA